MQVRPPTWVLAVCRALSSHWRKRGGIREHETPPRRPHQSALHCWHKVGCVNSVPTSGPGHSQPRWLPLSTKVNEAELSRKLFTPPPFSYQAECFTLRELILGIKMLTAWWRIRAEEITLLKNYVLCARRYPPTLLYIYQTYTGHTELCKLVSTNEWLRTVPSTSQVM